MSKYKKLDAESLLKEVGDWYGDFWTNNGKYYIDNSQKVFCYTTPEDGLRDWLDTMIQSNEDEEVETWSKEEIAFVKSLNERSINMSENLARLKALVAETNEVVANLNKETENINVSNQITRLIKFREIRDYLMECYKITQTCGRRIRVKINSSAKYLDYDTTTFLQISCDACEIKPITFVFEYIDRVGDRCISDLADSSGIGAETEWKTDKKRQYFFGSWFNNSDECYFVDNWDQEEFEREFAAEVERVITEKANEANEKYQNALSSQKLLKM